MTLAAAVAHLQAGRPQLALSIVETRLAEQANDSEAWFVLGACSHALKDLPKARDAFSHSLGLRPDHLEAHLALAAVAREMGEARNALTACQKGLEIFPSEPRLHHAAALALEQLGHNEEALSRYNQALANDPTSQNVLQDRGLLLVRMGRTSEAELNYRSYLRAHPDSPRARAGLADILLAMSRYDEVIELLADASQEPLLLFRRGLALASQRRFGEARQAFAESRRQDPDSIARFVHRIVPGSDIELVVSPENIFLERCYASLRNCDWSKWPLTLAEAKSIAAKPDLALAPLIGFMARFLPLSGPERHAVTRAIAGRIEGPITALPPRGPSQRPRIRLGVLSPDFRDHLNADLLLPLFELLDRRRFEVHAYSLGADDGSAARARIGREADVFCELRPMSDEQAARLIRQNDVDILVDAAGHTTGARFGIMAHRPARLHVNYLGFSCSLGSKRIDYAIADRISAPTPEEWSEALAYVPHAFFLYDYRVPVPEIPISRRDYGLPGNAFVYCAFHRAEKISPDAFDLWMEVLAQVPGSVMWFHPLPAAAAANLRSHASARGVDPARLFFAPFEPRHQPRYLARQRLGDLFLDSLHHNAMTTACDALGVGLPLLTLPGRAIAARTGASLLRAAGLPELIAGDRQGFVATAVQLAREPMLLQAYKDRLSRNRLTAPLFDTPGMVRILGAAFEHMFERAKRGERPATFDIQAPMR